MSGGALFAVTAASSTTWSNSTAAPAVDDMPQVHRSNCSNGAVCVENGTTSPEKIPAVVNNATECDPGHTSSTHNSLSDVITYEKFDECDPQYENSRSVLPCMVMERSQVSIWSILKQSIGKDLTRITVPVVFNEPLTFLQRLVEYLEHVELIHKAAEQLDALKRLEYVSAFAVSALSSNRERITKPFNPILGETYELDRTSDMGFRVVMEQVSHHPPMTAFYAEGNDFQFYGSILPKIRFWGKSAECQPKGTVTLKLLKHNEVYTWSQVNANAHNLFVGKMYIDLTGTMEINCHTTHLKSCIQFKPSANWYGKESNGTLIHGYIMDKNKQKVRALYGDWTEFLASCSVDNFEQHFATWGKEHKDDKETKRLATARGGGSGHSPPPNRRFSTTGVTANSPTDDDGPQSPNSIVHFKSTKMPRKVKENAKNCVTVLPVLLGSDVLWRAKTKPQNPEQFYHFTYFSMLLNELTDEVRQTLPPTDSRLRPDVRYMEDGNTEMAAEEKHRLEEKQRAVRAERKKNKQDWTAKWFVNATNEYAKGEETWVFNNKYFDRDWSCCDDIF